jgi:hypothetical protein
VSRQSVGSAVADDWSARVDVSAQARVAVLLKSQAKAGHYKNLTGKLVRDREAICRVLELQQRSQRRLTVVDGDNRVGGMANSVSKIQIGQLWKKDGTGDTYLVTRVYSEALSTMVTLRKSGSETEALVRVKLERTADGQTLQGFSPAQEDERF